MMEKRWCWVCEQCGFAWIVKFDKPGEAVMPEQCPSSHFRSRQWDGTEPKKRGRPRKAVQSETERFFIVTDSLSGIRSKVVVAYPLSNICSSIAVWSYILHLFN